MPKIKYRDIHFRAKTLAVISQANEICQDYEAQGFVLTLRQLYYQFVSRGLISNKDSEYDRLGSILNDARLAGLMDWDHMEDRTRNLRERSHWDNPAEIISASAQSYYKSRWDSQSVYVEVWIEKDALVGVIEGVCRRLDVPHFSCRGYCSQSEMWAAAQRLLDKQDAGKELIILHLGDHDPSGIDMTEDIQRRLHEFMWEDGPEVRRIALTMEQIRFYNPPPNPAKATDARYAKYRRRYGDESWELDALEPNVIVDLVDNAVQDVIDPDAWDEVVASEEVGTKLLIDTFTRWGDVVELLRRSS